MIEAVIFDIGGVLVNFSYEPFRQFLLDHGAPVRSHDDFLKAVRLLDYESGRISGQNFINTLREITNGRASQEDLILSWTGIFSPIEPMLELLDQLKRQKQVYLLSNTNELHWNFLNREYHLHDRVDGAVVSFQAGVMKPDPKIYRYFTDTFKLKPDEIVFIDDREENAAAARSEGWNEIHHRSIEHTVRALANLGGLSQA